MSQSKRATIYLDSDLHRALAEDAEDLKAFENRAQEPNLDFDKVVRSMRRRGKL